MNTLMQMGPMMVMEGPNGMHHHQTFPQPSQHMPQAPITSSMNRSQRCGICRGCQCKPCGQCTYCQDSPQFGGPGVKKQSCIERRCLRVLENRLQRDAPTFKARVGCNQCEDCRMADCQICLVCLDRRFFDNRYMTGAMCAKKRCNNATSIELPAQSPHAMHEYQQRQAQKRAYDHQTANQFHVDMKRRAEMGFNGHPVQHQQQSQQYIKPEPLTQQAQQQNGRVLAMNPSVNNYGMPPPMQPMRMPPMASNVVSMPVNCPPSSTVVPLPEPPTATYMMPFGHTSPSQIEFFDIKPYNFEEITSHNGDPFIPPSYVPEMKNAVVLQPL